MLGLGANLGARELALISAIRTIGLFFEVTAISKFYLSEPVIPKEASQRPPRGQATFADRPFINAAIKIRTALAAEDLLRVCLTIETHLGRVRASQQRWQNRTIDIDILWSSLGNYSSPTLAIPHPELHRRAFAWQPAIEIEPALRALDTQFAGDSDVLVEYARTRIPYSSNLTKLVNDTSMTEHSVRDMAGLELLYADSTSVWPSVLDPLTLTIERTQVAKLTEYFHDNGRRPWGMSLQRTSDKDVKLHALTYSTEYLAHTDTGEPTS